MGWFGGQEREVILDRVLSARSGEVSAAGVLRLSSSKQKLAKSFGFLLPPDV